MPFNFGAPGIVFATVAINFLTCSALLLRLKSRIKELPLKEWVLDGSKLLIAGSISGLTAWTMRTGINWPEGFIGLFSQVSFSATTSIFVFGLIGNAMGVKEVKELKTLISKKLIRL